MRVFGVFIIFIIYSFSADCQSFSNKGKDFWVGYGYHVRMLNTGTGTSQQNGQNMVLYFATEEITNITITTGTGYTQTLTSGPAPTVLTSAIIPKTGAQDVRLTAESTAPENKGIHITSDKPIVAYAHIYDQSVSGATILFPTNTLGKEYYSINYNNVSNEDNSNCWFYVIATDTGTTTVEITPSANTINHAAGTPFTVNLTQGQVYNFMGQLTGSSGGGGGGGGTSFTGVDLTGTKIKSIASGTGGCKRIAVFSGSGKINIRCNSTTNNSADNYMVQAFPKDAWGKKFLTVPTRSLSNNIFRVCVSDPATIVRLNGLPIGLPLINNFYYEIAQTPFPLKIEADQPITVAQYITTQGACNNPSSTTNPGDPEVIYLSPVEQNIARVIWNATPNFAITQHYYNVVIPNAGTAISSFKLDGVPVNPAAFTVHPQDAGYAYISALLNNSGVHVIESDSGFNAISYGYGNAESYGYNAGTNIKDLYNKLEPLNPLSISNEPVACRGTGLNLAVTFPFQPTSLYWDFHGNPYQFPNTNVTVAAPVADTTYYIGTKQVWRYKLPTLYIFSQSNTSPGFPITITAGTTSSDGCGNFVEREFYLQVYDPPNVKFVWQNNGCVNDPVVFIDSTQYGLGTFSYLWEWYLDDGNTDNSHNPVHTFLAPGTYNVNFSLTTNVGCVNDTTIAVRVDPLPQATITGTTAVCLNATSPTLTLAASTGASPFAFNYSINGGTAQTITSVGNDTTISVPTSPVGTYSYELTGVKGGLCFQNQTTAPAVVTVNPLPTATVSGTVTVCRNSTSPFITFKGSGATAPYTFSYSINGGVPLTVVSGPGDSATVAVPTSNTGTFTYTLLNVTDGSTTACLQNQSGSATVTIVGLPTATIQGTTAVCQNAASPVVTLTGANGTAPYLFTYAINGGAPQTISTAAGNSVSINAPTATAGLFNYQLISVQESGANQCSQAQAGTAGITIWQLPNADFQYSLPACSDRTINFSDISTPYFGTLTAWHWDFGDGSPVSNTQNPIHSFNGANTYDVKLYVTTSNGCASPEITKQVEIYPNPVAGFIDPEVCLDDTYAQFLDTSTVAGGSIVQWSWTFGDPASGALNTSTNQNPTHSYSTTGTKNIILIVTSNRGCIDTLYQSFYVNGDIPTAGVQVINPNGLCANDSIAIINTSTVNVGNIVKVEIYWDNAGSPAVFETDDYPTPGKIYKHLYTNFQNPLTSNFTIRLVAYSGITCLDDVTQNITVNAAPKVLFSSIPDTCRFISPFQLTEASETGGVPGTFTYTGNGITASGVFDPAITGTGLFPIKYTYTSTAGCRDSATQNIRVLEPPLANFGFVSPACEDRLVTFVDSSQSLTGSLIRWTWNFNDGTAAVVRNDNNSFTHQFDTAGNYSIQLVVRNAEGCNSDIKTKVVYINPNPRADFTYSDTACLPSAAVLFTNAATIADGTQSSFTYSWNFGDPGSGAQNSSSAINPTHVYGNLGPYSVTLNVRSGAGCTDDTTIAVNSIHPQPNADFSFDKASICEGDNVTFSDQSDPLDGSSTAWYWNFGDGGLSNQQNPNYTFTSAGDFPVSLYIVNSFGCRSDTMTKTYNVYEYPSVNAGPDRYILEGDGQTIQATATGRNLEYLWSPATYLNNTTVLTPVCTPMDDIEYTLTVTGIGGCVSSDIVKVMLLKNPLIPNTFTPNGDGINDKWEIEYLKYYPNPRIQIFTRTGQLVYESRSYWEPWDGTMKGKPLPMDTYYYIIEPGNGRQPFSGYVTIIR